MLNLMNNGVILGTFAEGAWFTMPNGDVISPAYEGWTKGDYSLVAAASLPPTKEQQELARQLAYTQEADPLFFKWQAGEGTEEEWLAKRQEIRDRYPYPAE